MRSHSGTLVMMTFFQRGHPPPDGSRGPRVHHPVSDRRAGLPSNSTGPKSLSRFYFNFEACRKDTVLSSAGGLLRPPVHVPVLQSRTRILQEKTWIPW